MSNLLTIKQFFSLPSFSLFIAAMIGIAAMAIGVHRVGAIFVNGFNADSTFYLESISSILVGLLTLIFTYKAFRVYHYLHQVR